MTAARLPRPWSGPGQRSTPRTLPTGVATPPAGATARPRARSCARWGRRERDEPEAGGQRGECTPRQREAVPTPTARCGRRGDSDRVGRVVSPASARTARPDAASAPIAFQYVSGWSRRPGRSRSGASVDDAGDHPLGEPLPTTAKAPAASTGSTARTAAARAQRRDAAISTPR